MDAPAQSMTPERWKRLEELFDAALALPEAERADFLEVACGGDHDLRDELQRMLLTLGGGELTGVIGQWAAAMENESWSGRRIGLYRVVRDLGKGGMGAVFLAVRDDDQFRKEAAIKTLKFEATDGSIVTRFRHERQILASLEHPNIARLLDGGATEQGTPYIVMEYVPGVPITDFCRTNDLSLEARVRLMRQVCEAVQYAHQKLIIHRDIKPGNILVSADGTPKLLDFGIAKLLDPAMAEAAPETRTGMLLMTPDYASPEQVRGDPVSTATDVYALGAVLFEMLTGERPHAFKSYDPAEIARIVCEVNPKTPSTLGGRRLRGDLDNIVLKAMHKEPARRYNSVEQFSEDLRRHLEGLPVRARPDTVIYRTGKYVQRHWVGLMAVLAVLAALLGGLAAERRQHSIAEQRFQDVRGLAHKFIFDFHDEVAKLQGSTKAREMIVATAREYLSSLTRSAGNDPALLNELAIAYIKVAHAEGSPAAPNLGRVSDSLASFEAAIDLHRRAVAIDPKYRVNLADSYGRLSKFQLLIGDHPGARKTLEEQLRVTEAIHQEQVARREPVSDDLLYTLALANVSLGDMLQEEDSRQALAAFRRTDEYMAELYKRQPTAEQKLRLHKGKARLGTCSRLAGEFQQCLEAMRDAERILNELLKAQPANPAYIRQRSIIYQDWSNLYDSYDVPNLGDRRKAIEYARLYVKNGEQMVAHDPNNVDAQFSLSLALLRLTEALLTSAPAEALTTARRSVQLMEENLTRSPGSSLVESRLARCLRGLAEALLATGNAKAGSETAERALNLQRLTLQRRPGDVDDQRVLVHILAASGESLLAAGNTDDGKQRLAEAVSAGEALAARQPVQLFYLIALARAYESWGAFHAGRGEGAEAAGWYARSASLWRGWQPSNVYVARRLKRAEELAAGGADTPPRRQ